MFEQLELVTKLEKAGKKLGKAATNVKKAVTRSLRFNKSKKKGATPALPQAPALDPHHQQLLLLVDKTTRPPLHRSKSQEFTVIKCPVTTMPLARAQSAPCALLAVPPAALVERSSASTSSFCTATSVGSNFVLNNSKSAASRPASPASTNYFSAASATIPYLGSRATSPVGSEQEGNTSGDWSIPAGRALSYLEGYNPSEALSKEEEAYEAFLVVAANTPAPSSWVTKLPGKINSASLPAPAPFSANGSGPVYLYDSGIHSAAAPRADSPEVGCLSIIPAMAKALLLLGKRPHTTTEWQPEATPASSTKARFLAPLKALGKKLDQAAVAIREELRATGRSMTDSWGSAASSLGSSFRRTRSSVGGGLDTATADGRSAGSSMGGAAEAAGGSFKRRVSRAGSSFGEVLDTTGAALKRRLSSAGSSLGGMVDEARAASDQLVNTVNKAVDKVKAGVKALKPASKKVQGPRGVSYGSEVVVGRCGQEWGIVMRPSLAAPVAAA